MDQNNQPHPFDQQIREQLAHLDPAYQAGSWERLSEKLENPVTGVDAQLREAFASIQPAYQPGSWDALSARMDTESVDEVVHQRLEQNEPAYQASSWARLAARLEVIAQRRSAIAAYKLSEVCLLLSGLLLLWTYFGNLIPAAPGLQNGFPVPAAAIAQNDTDALPADLPIVAMPVFTAPTPVSNETSQEEANASSGNQATLTSGSTLPTSLPTYYPNYLTNERNTFRYIPTSVTEPLPSFTYALNEASTSPQPPLILPAKLLKQPKSLYLRTFVSPWDFNQVVTPEAYVGDAIIERENRVTYGMSAGVLLDVEQRKNVMQYGLIYSKRSYIPTVLKSVEDVPFSILEVRDTNYSRLVYHTVSLPVQFQRELANNGRWRIAASAGLAINLNVASRFVKGPTFDQDVINWLRQTRPVALAASRERGGNVEVLEASDLVSPEKGLLQGGSLLANSSVYLHLGFSFERALSDDFSLFVAPQFSRVLYYKQGTGLEPFNDRIHSNSVQLGARFRISGERR